MNQVALLVLMASQPGSEVATVRMDGKSILVEVRQVRRDTVRVVRQESLPDSSKYEPRAILIGPGAKCVAITAQVAGNIFTNRTWVMDMRSLKVLCTLSFSNYVSEPIWTSSMSIFYAISDVNDQSLRVDIAGPDKLEREYTPLINQRPVPPPIAQTAIDVLRREKVPPPKWDLGDYEYRPDLFRVHKGGWLVSDDGSFIVVPSVDKGSLRNNCITLLKREGDAWKVSNVSNISYGTLVLESNLLAIVSRGDPKCRKCELVDVTTGKMLMEFPAADADISIP